MATINFPLNPIVNQIYIYKPGLGDEKSFIFKAGETGASDGYWSMFPSVGFGPASVLEIDAGVIADKFIAPDQLELSKYNTDISPLKTKASFAGVGFDHYGATAPAGGLPCNGTSYLITSYPELYAVIGDLFATTGGQAAPAVGSFRVPIQEVDGYGLFNRGVGLENGGVGTYEEDMIKSHTHLSLNTATTTAGVLGLPSARSQDYDYQTTTARPETRPKALTVLKCIWTGK